MPENRIGRGDIYYVHLDPAFGREIGGYKRRPVAVISIDGIHQNTRVIAVVPGTSTPSNHPNAVRVVGDRGNGLDAKEPTFFQCHQVRAIDQGRMTSPPVGRLSQNDLRRVEEGLMYSLGLLKK